MTERLQVYQIDDDERRRLMRIIRRGSGSVVTWLRAQMVLLSAQGMDVPAIAKVAFTSEDRVQDVIRNFNADGFGSLYPKYRGYRLPKFTLAQWREIKRKVVVALLMRSHLWTRKVAVALLISLFALTAAFTIVGILVKSLSTAASIISALSQAATLTIALFMPLSGKDEARRKIRAAMSQYVILDSLKAGQPDKARVLNRVINRMRELAPTACFREEEIAEYLESTDVGERFAALASVQWQWWDDDEGRRLMPFFAFGKKSRELPGAPDHPSGGYFPQLLKVLCDSWDEFENYHAMVAMWSMVASHLGPKDMQKLFKRVLDQSAVPLDHTCNEWGKFIEDLNGRQSAHERDQSDVAGDECDICGAEKHPHGSACRRCKGILNRVETRRSSSGALRQFDREARHRAMQRSWRDGAFHCFYTDIVLVDDPSRWRDHRYLVFEHQTPDDEASVVVTCALVNRMKTDLTAEQFKAMVTELAKAFGGGSFDERVFPEGVVPSQGTP